MKQIQTFQNIQWRQTGQHLLIFQNNVPNTLNIRLNISDTVSRHYFIRRSYSTTMWAVTSMVVTTSQLFYFPVMYKIPEEIPWVFETITPKCLQEEQLPANIWSPVIRHAHSQHKASSLIRGYSRNVEARFKAATGLQIHKAHIQQTHGESYTISCGLMTSSVWHCLKGKRGEEGYKAHRAKRWWHSWQYLQPFDARADLRQQQGAEHTKRQDRRSASHG